MNRDTECTVHDLEVMGLNPSQVKLGGLRSLLMTDLNQNICQVNNGGVYFVTKVLIFLSFITT